MCTILHTNMYVSITKCVCMPCHSIPLKPNTYVRMYVSITMFVCRSIPLKPVWFVVETSKDKQHCLTQNTYVYIRTYCFFFQSFNVLFFVLCYCYYVRMYMYFCLCSGCLYIHQLLAGVSQVKIRFMIPDTRYCMYVSLYLVGQMMLLYTA